MSFPKIYTKVSNENFLKKKNNNDDDVEKIYSRFNVLLKCSFSSTHILYTYYIRVYAYKYRIEDYVEITSNQSSRVNETRWEQ